MVKEILWIIAKAIWRNFLGIIKETSTWIGCIGLIFLYLNWTDFLQTLLWLSILCREKWLDKKSEEYGQKIQDLASGKTQPPTQ